MIEDTSTATKFSRALGDGVEGLDLNAHGEIGRKRLISCGRVALPPA